MKLLKIRKKSIIELKKILKNIKEYELDQSTISQIKNEIIRKKEKHKELFDNLKNSPYYNIGSEYWHIKGILEPNPLHALIVFHEFAKLDHKINK